MPKGVPPPRKPKRKTRKKLKPTAQIAHETPETIEVTDAHGRVIKRVLLGAEAPDKYGMVQCAQEERPLTPYEMLLARVREETLLRRWHKEAAGLSSWKLEKPK